jgi:hypothetical protein
MKVVYRLPFVAWTMVPPICLAAALIPTGTAAQLSTTPGYTAYDQQQQAKLRGWVGTWKCADTPPSKKPDIETTKQEGNFFVTRETGDNPNTEYTRWSHSYKMFYTAEIDDQGGTIVSSTKSLNPLNASSLIVFPSRDSNGRAFFPNTIVTTATTITNKGQYYDDKGKLKTFNSVCTKTG